MAQNTRSPEKTAKYLRDLLCDICVTFCEKTVNIWNYSK